jgi:hypothetical protein
MIPVGRFTVKSNDRASQVDSCTQLASDSTGVPRLPQPWLGPAPDDAPLTRLQSGYNTEPGFPTPSALCYKC